MTSGEKSDYWGGPLAVAMLAPFSPVLLFGLLHFGMFSDNFHVVTAGRFYRSGQMDERERFSEWWALLGYELSLT